MTLEEVSAEIKFDGPTWLDKQSFKPDAIIAPEISNGLTRLQKQRDQYLVKRGVTSNEEPRPTDLLRRTRELERRIFVDRISREINANYVSLSSQPFEGRAYDPVELRGGTYSVIVGKDGFTVVPVTRDLKNKSGQDVRISV